MRGKFPAGRATIRRVAGSKEVADPDPRPEGADEDVQLMLALRAGDDGAFDALFHRWAGALLRYLERMVTSRAQAEELMQETFLRVYRARERYEVRARFSTWLYTIATRVALNELRRPAHRSLDALPEESDYGAVDRSAPQPAVDDVVDARLRAAQVEGALRALPERQRAALWLAAVEGMSYAEVAEALEASPQSVKALVHRARATLAESASRATAADAASRTPTPAVSRATCTEPVPRALGAGGATIAKPADADPSGETR